MKKFSLFIALMLIAVAAFTQAPAKAEVKPTVANCSIDQSGNYTALQKTQAQPTPTTKTFTDSKGGVHKVWISPKGREFYTRVSKKSGEEYKVYLTPATQIPPGKPGLQ